MIVTTPLAGPGFGSGLGFGLQPSVVIDAKQKLARLGFWSGEATAAENQNFGNAVRAFQQAWNAAGSSYTIRERPPASCRRAGLQNGSVIGTLSVDGDYGCRTGYALAGADAAGAPRAPAGVTPPADGGAIIGTATCRTEAGGCPGARTGPPSTDPPPDEPPVAAPSFLKKWWWVGPVALAVGGGGYLLLAGGKKQPGPAVAGFGCSCR